MDISNLKQFLIQFNEAGFASDNRAMWTKELDGSTSITYENGDTLGYLLIIIMDQYGKNTIVNDLFNNIITIPLLKKKSITEANKKKLEKLKDEEIKTTTKKTKPIKTSIITKGIDKQGKQKEAKIEYVIVNKKPQKRLRDIKTGRFLKSLW